jgi:hypothetical protein
MSRPITPILVLALALALGSAKAASTPEDVGVVGPAFAEGDVITVDKIDSLRPYLPEPFWTNRDFFFYEGMQMEIGPSYFDYSPAPVYQEATKRHSAKVALGPDNSLENYQSGQPFPLEEIDCEHDPQGGAKVAWNFVRRWEGAAGTAQFYYSYWDRGEELPLHYEGHAQGVSLAYRPEPQYEKNGGDVFRNEVRYEANGPTVTAPFDARGIMLLTYRYNDDTWVYVPALRRVRRISSAQRTDAVAGTDFTMDDLFSFSGIVPQYEWECLGERDLIAPMNSKVKGFPYVRGRSFGPYGLSFADDRWELRHAIQIRFTPNNPEHPYHHKDIWIDKQTLEPLYSFAYDRKGELWKIITHNHRWSGDNEEYIGWENVPEPRDLTVVSDIIANVQTGTGNRIEIWDRIGTAMQSKGRIRRFTNVGRLTRGR